MESAEVVIKHVSCVVRRKGWEITNLQEKGICYGINNSSFSLSYKHTDFSKFLFICQRMHIAVESRSILEQPLPNHNPTAISPKQSSAALLRIALHNTKFTYCLCTRPATDVRLRLVTLPLISSAVEGQKDLLYSCLPATNLLTGFLIYRLELPSVESFW